MGNGRRCSSTTKKVAPPTAQNFTYDGTQKTGVLAGEGYTLSGTTTAIAAGDYTAVATLQSGYVWNDGTSNAKTISWSISALGISGASVSVPTQTYTGSALTPVPTVTLNGKALVYGTDFTCEWTNNTDAGTGYVKVIGKGNYSVETGTVAFTISQKSMAGISASVSGSFVYNGSGHTPDPVVKDGTTQLVKDRDYTLSYNNNVNAGTASVTITGKGIYTGSKTVNFKIDKASYGVSLVTTNADFSLFAKGDLHDFLIGSYSGTPTFTSSDLNVIKVNADGTYEVVGMGKATIRVSIPGGNNYYDFNAGVEKTVEVKDCFRIVGSDGTAKYYKTLAEAVAAVPANCTATISVIGSPKMDEGVTIDNGKNITLRGENGATLVRGDNFKDTAFSIAGGSLTIEDLTIDGNETVAHPTDSLIDVSGGKLTVGEGAVLVNNKVQGASGAKGGAIYADGGEVVIDGGSLTDNSANKGGAIAVEGDAVLTIKGGALEGNGVIGTGCSGGAIWVGGGAQVTIEDGDFQKNGTISGDGGAIYVEGGSLEIKGGTFEGNYAGFAGLYAQKGGAVAVMGGEVTISGGTMVNNSAVGVGNGVYIAPEADITLAGSGTAGITDAFGIGYDEAGNASGMINVDGALDHQVNVAFQNPAAQAQEGVEYVRSDDNTSADLKEDFRVTNPGYTFKPVDDPQNSTGALELVKSDTVVAVILGEKDSAATEAIVSEAVEAIGKAESEANAQGTVADLDKIVSDAQAAAEEQRAEEKADAKADVDAALDAVIDSLPDNLREEAEAIADAAKDAIDAGGNINIVNNSEITTVINQTQEISQASVTVGIEYGESLPRVEIVIRDNLETIKEHIPAIIDGPYYKGVTALGASSVDLLFIAKCREEDIFQVQRDMNRELKLLFDANDIGIPFPQVVVNQPATFNARTTKRMETGARDFLEEQKEQSKGMEEEDL